MAADHAVVCVRRIPNTDDLGFEVTDVTPDERGIIPVDLSDWAGQRIVAIGDSLEDRRFPQSNRGRATGNFSPSLHSGGCVL